MPQKKTFDDLCAEILDHKKQFRKPRTHQVYVAPVNHLLKTFSGILIKNISPDDFWDKHVPRAWKESPKRNLNNDRKLFIMVMWRAYGKGLIKRPPIRIDKPNKSHGNRRAYTKDEVHRFLKTCKNTKLKHQIILAFLTGMRLQELLKLRWEFIDFEKCEIHLPPTYTKTGVGRTFSISKSATIILKDRLAIRRSDTPWVFPSRVNNFKAQTTNRSTWTALRDLLGLHDRVWHEWRHTCATGKKEAGINKDLVSKELGMSEEVLMQIYYHPSHSALQKSSEAMESALGDVA